MGHSGSEEELLWENGLRNLEENHACCVGYVHSRHSRIIRYWVDVLVVRFDVDGVVRYLSLS